MEYGLLPAAAVAVLMALRLPSLPMVYCETFALFEFAT